MDHRGLSRKRTMSIEEKVAFDLDDLPLDVFELADAGVK
jgi:hypothetical protein